MNAEHFYASQNELGEGPRWDSKTQRLYWVDIFKGTFQRMNLKTKRVEQFNTGSMLGCLGFVRDGLVCGQQRGLTRWNFQAKIAAAIHGLVLPPDVRFNDGGMDRRGRFWAGTKAPQGQACLYRLDLDGSIHVAADGFTICNGIGWSPDNRTLYFTDSPSQVIYAYDFDLPSGTLSNRRIFAQISEPGVEPDGLTVDAEGCVWSALWDGWRVVRFDPQGKVEREVRLPVARVTACAFGGLGLDTLFITTAYAHLSAEKRAAQPLAGDLFACKPGVKGLPEPYFGES